MSTEALLEKVAMILEVQSNTIADMLKSITTLQIENADLRKRVERLERKSLGVDRFDIGR